MPGDDNINLKVKVVLMDIAERLRYFRDKTGTLGKTIAISMGVEESFISGVFTGKKKCSTENLEKICNVMGVSLQEFYSNDDLLTAEERALVDNFRAIKNPEARKRITSLAEIEQYRQNLPLDVQKESNS